MGKRLKPEEIIAELREVEFASPAVRQLRRQHAPNGPLFWGQTKPPELTATRLLRTSLPLLWADQEQILLP